MGDIHLFGIPISLGTMIYQAALFTLLFYILKKYFVEKLFKVIIKRKVSIENQLKLAHEYTKKAEAHGREQEQLLRNAQIESTIIIRKSREEADLIIKKARQEAMEIRSQAYMRKGGR